MKPLGGKGLLNSIYEDQAQSVSSDMFLYMVMLNSSQNNKITGVLIIRGTCIPEIFENSLTTFSLMASKVDLCKPENKKSFENMWDDDLIERLYDEKVVIFV